MRFGFSQVAIARDGVLHLCNDGNLAGKMKRTHLRLKTKLAAALLALGDVPFETSKTMTEDEICACYQFDHYPIRHADGGTDHPSNLTPRLVVAHREKTKRDAGERAKVRRIDAKWRTFMGAIAKGQKPPPHKSRWPRRTFRK